MQRVWCCLSRGKEARRSSLSVSTSRPELNLDVSTLLHLLLCRICWGDGACCRCWPWLAASGTSGKRLSSRESWSRQSLRRCVIDMFGACDHPKKIESGGLVTKKGDAPGVIGVCVVFFLCSSSQFRLLSPLLLAAELVGNNYSLREDCVCPRASVGHLVVLASSIKFSRTREEALF